MVWLLLSFVLWFWHLPAPYTWALDNEAVHVIEHLSFLTISLAFWTIVIEPYGNRRTLGLGATLLYVASIGFQNGLLGAVLTFATRPLYPIDATGTAIYGLTPLADQQLAGTLMWVPASAIHLWTLCALFMAWLQLAERRASTMNTALPVGAVRCALIAPVLTAMLIGCSDDDMQPTWRVAGGYVQRGPALIQRYGCGACSHHTRHCWR